MADEEHNSAKRLTNLDRFRILKQETTDPLATQLVSDIISELEASANVEMAAPAKPHD